MTPTNTSPASGAGLILALRTIAEFPATDMLLNMDAANMRRIAEAALSASQLSSAQEGVRDWAKVESFVDEYVADYEMRGEAEDGRDACYTPNDNDRALLRDCIAGLLAEPEFLSALAGQSKSAAPVEPAGLPEGWVPLRISFDGDEEEVAYGPQIMMDRLKKWLDRYYAMKLATPPSATPEAPVTGPVSNRLRMQAIPEAPAQTEAKCLPNGIRYMLPPLVLSGYQLREAMTFIAPDGTDEQMEQEACIAERDAGIDMDGQPYPAGLCCWMEEYPEEGSIALDGTVNFATPSPAPVQTHAGASEHYDEVKATLTNLHGFMESLSAAERRIGPAGSHARGYTHKITAALRHLDALAQPGDDTKGGA
ncbi:hypothetical protein J7E62_27385 [Variovorax paradoxus]|nr:hypothetical protein [Variovorax paradoxus]